MDVLTFRCRSKVRRDKRRKGKKTSKGECYQSLLCTAITHYGCVYPRSMLMLLEKKGYERMLRIKGNPHDLALLHSTCAEQTMQLCCFSVLAHDTRFGSAPSSSSMTHRYNNGAQSCDGGGDIESNNENGMCLGIVCVCKVVHGMCVYKHFHIDDVQGSLVRENGNTTQMDER